VLGLGFFKARKFAVTSRVHTQVGFAAVSTSIAHFIHAAAEHAATIGTMTLVTAHLGTLIGAITLTGSAVAFAKLRGLMSSAPFSLPFKNLINTAILGGCFYALKLLLATTAANMSAAVDLLYATAAAGVTRFA
jgi:H+-translocating NAD(P) transhydrogenase